MLLVPVWSVFHVVAGEHSYDLSTSYDPQQLYILLLSSFTFGRHLGTLHSNTISNLKICMFFKLLNLDALYNMFYRL
jgi:hypothetical protein